MRRSRLLVIPLLVALPAAGCGGCGATAPTSTGPPAAGKKLTWEEYQKLPEDQRGEPGVMESLDEAARRRLAGGKKGK